MITTSSPSQANAIAAPGDSLAERRREIRRRRRRGTRVLLSCAYWGAATLLVGWLLISGVFGLPTG